MGTAAASAPSRVCWVDVCTCSPIPHVSQLGGGGSRTTPHPHSPTHTYLHTHVTATTACGSINRVLNWSNDPVTDSDSGFRRDAPRRSACFAERLEGKPTRPTALHSSWVCSAGCMVPPPGFRQIIDQPAAVGYQPLTRPRQGVYRVRHVLTNQSIPSQRSERHWTLADRTQHTKNLAYRPRRSWARNCPYPRSCSLGACCLSCLPFV